MWVIRFLSGSLAGQSFTLKDGKNTIGRSANCDIIVADTGVSKLHADIYALDDKVIITDLNSSNGTYINGVRIQSRKIGSSDKAAIYNILFDVQALSPQVYAAKQQHQQAMQQMASQQNFQAPQNYPQNSAQNFGAPMHGADPMSPQMQHPGGAETPNQQQPKDIKETVQQYVENVALPGVYKLSELTEFKWVLGGFMMAFIVLVTALSVIPMVQISKSSIEKESRRRALGIARNLKKMNESALLQGLESAVSVQSAKIEEGVKVAMIISHADGHIIAPVNKAGEYAKQPFVHTARRETKEVVKQLDSTTIGASVPVAFYNPEVGASQVAAHAVVLYNMGTLAVDDGRTISLFIQTLLMALILGGILFFFLYKLIEHPIRDLNRQLDSALKDGRDHVETKFQLPILHEFCDNINSALTRAVYGSDSQQDGGGASAFSADKDIEAENLLRIIGCPGLSINKEGVVISTNEEFEAFTGVSLHELKSRGIDAIPDQAFQLSLNDLMERVRQQPDLIASNTLEISGVNCELNAQAVSGPKSEPAYFVITIQSADSYSEEVA